MAPSTPEDHDRIRDLQENLTRAVERWDASGRQDQEFDNLVPIANELVSVQQELLHERTQAWNALLRQRGGWAAGVLAVIFLAVMLFAGWTPWLLVVVLALAVPGFLLVVGVRRDQTP